LLPGEQWTLIEGMKITIAFLSFTCALTLAVQAAEVSVKISGVHMCCKGCVTGAEKAIAEVKGVQASVDQDAKTVSITGPDKAAVQKAAVALVAAGYFGKSSDEGIKLGGDTGAKDKTVKTLKIEGVHLCCGKCVTVVDEAVKSVPGVKDHTAVKNAASFEVSGEFNDKQVLEAIRKAGLSGKVAK